ncbi:MAG: hypothetical protein R3Y23_02620 [Bacillota bacterium]
MIKYNKKHEVPEIVREIQKDFDDRREVRRNIETKWLLNINFMLGNQYATISPSGAIVDNDRQYVWQEHEVYNHIAPIIEARLSKFTRINASVTVRPASSSDNDINVAKLSTKLIDTATNDNDYIALSGNANYWSEITGTSFYKVMWDTKKGNMVAQDTKTTYNEGDIAISVCPPYEIYPDSLQASDIDNCTSIIHARAYPVKTIEEIWGVKVEGKDISVMNMDITNGCGGLGYVGKNYKVFSEQKVEHEIVIERYEAPSKDNPDGRLVIIAGDCLLFDGKLPYKNMRGGKRGFPFVRQVALTQPCSFYGISIIERLIPIQRAYNAVKNRKHEFINRLACGIIAVEDGSVDVESLQDEGLSPGKIITYRQGSSAPSIMSAGSVPSELRDEEDRLLSEFTSISGISSVWSDTTDYSGTTVSGYALSLLLEQDYSRMTITTESMRRAIREISHHILRLYRQFAHTERIVSISDDNGELETMAFLGSELNSDDIIMEADSEMVETPAVRKQMVIELLQYGLLGDEDGKLNSRSKAKVLEMLGFGNWESARCLEELHIKKAMVENQDILQSIKIEVEEVDDHDIHIEEHGRYIVSNGKEMSKKTKSALTQHIRDHKIMKRITIEADAITSATTETI